MSHIEFREMKSKPLTKVWHVISRSSGDSLGEIAWYAPWRQYCFTPTSDEIVFSRGCLEEICKFIEEHKDDRVGD